MSKTTNFTSISSPSVCGLSVVGMEPELEDGVMEDGGAAEGLEDVWHGNITSI